MANKKTKEQKHKWFICFPARAQAFSWLSDVTGLQSKRDENNRSSPALYKLRQWMKTKFFIQAQWKSLWLKQQFMKSDQKCNCNVSNACLCLDRSANQFSFSLAIFDWSPQKTLMLNVQPSNSSICAPACSKIAWGWICWTVKTFCCVVVEVLTWFSSDWANVPGSQFRIPDISRCRFREAEWKLSRLFKFLWPLSCATKFGWTSASRSRPTLVFLTEWLETFFLFVSSSLAAANASFFVPVS